MKPMKKIIVKTLETDIALDSKVDEVIERLIELAERYPGWALRLEKNYNYDYQWHDLVGERPETDAEQQARLSQEAEELRKKEERQSKRASIQQEKYNKRIQELEAEIARLRGKA
jgi:hydroxymethylpyrimidine pyrophosphatase-like HAD family hydrolase